jgi:hypothetical protein
MNDEFTHRLKAALEALEPDLERNVAPVGVVEDQASNLGYMTMSEQLEMRNKLKKLDSHTLSGLFGAQLQKQGQGIPIDAWMRSGGGRAIETLLDGNPTIRKALDSAQGGGSPLIRQDLEPLLYELYIRTFPAWDRFAKEPANGLVHAYNRHTGYGDAQFMTELGTVTDDVSTYERATTPISIIATRRGVTLKNQYATIAGGAGFNPEQLELQAGLRAIAHKMQKTIFQGNATASGGTAANEYGAYDVNGFDGLRSILNTVRAVDVDPTGATPENIRAAFNEAMITTTQNAGSPSVIYIDPMASGQFDVQQDDLVRYIERDNISVGVTVQTVATTMGRLPLFVIPGDSIGEYTYTGNTYSDAYLIDESAISIPFLGSDGPTVLDIPMGVSGQLTRLFIIFGMWGFAPKAIQFHNKVRIRRA